MPQNSARPFRSMRSEMRIAIHGQCAIARHADRDQAKVAELWRRAVPGALADVAARAIALRFVVEELQAVQFGLRQLRVAREVGVVLAGVRIESLGRLLEGFERLQHGFEGRVVAFEHVFAERRAESAGVRRGFHGRSHFGRRAAHFERRQQRNSRLVGAAIDAAIPGQAAGRTRVDALVALVVRLVIVLGECRHRLQILQRRRGAHAGPMHIAAAQLNRQRIGRREPVIRAVARRASEFARAGERRIEKQLLAERGHLPNGFVDLGP